MRENRTQGSARGALGNRWLYLNRLKKYHYAILVDLLLCCGVHMHRGTRIFLRFLSTKIFLLVERGRCCLPIAATRGVIGSLENSDHDRCVQFFAGLR